jgi:glycolate oxidase iron-sulfur subunit
VSSAVEKCVHCGFCLPTCPTYAVLNEEIDSPRGRILLMKSVLEGELELEEALPYIDRCLGCLGCVSACPSGVPYGEMLSLFREYAEQRRRRPVIERVARTLMQETIPYPRRFRLAAQAGKLAKPFKSVMPEQFQGMLHMLPDELPAGRTLPALYPARGKRRGRVALLAGCVQQVLSPEINWATLRVLAANGVEVVIPPEQGCCGALAMHTGELGRARSLAAHNIAVFPQDVDAILTNAAGCGSAMHEYPLLFEGAEREQQAKVFADRVLDVSVFLDQLGLLPVPPLTDPLILAYHDACHLAHAQKVVDPPRRLLAQIENLTLVAFPESDLCCGSAGSYNLEQPAIASALGQRKVTNILSSGAQAVATGNIGCIVQLKQHLAQAHQPLPVWHTLQVLDMAYHL